MKLPRTKPSLPVPTNGHPTRKAAIIDLYEQGVQQKEIVKRLACSRNSVSSVIHEYRVKTGRYIDPVEVQPPMPRAPSLPDITETSMGYRWLNYRKSTKGAREALAAMGAQP
jgi:hypothetical protein